MYSQKNWHQRTPVLSLEAIKKSIKGDIGREIFFYETVGSTNTIAAQLAEKGAQEGTAVLADSQEKGRGRLGRQWVSPPSVNIYTSIILRPKIKPKDVTLLTIMAAVGCTSALRKVTGLDISIKWPNDLTVSDKKIGGILTEVKTAPDKIVFAITGIGINVNMDSNAFPDEIKHIATSVKNETAKLYQREVIISEVFNEISYWYKALNEMRRDLLLSEWQKMTSTLGKKVQVIIGKETVTGLAESIDDEGMLNLRLPDGLLKKISTGDIAVLK